MGESGKCRVWEGDCTGREMAYPDCMEHVVEESAGSRSPFV